MKRMMAAERLNIWRKTRTTWISSARCGISLMRITLRSPKYFKDTRAVTTFDMRKKQLMEKSYQGALRIDLARDAVTKEYIGYCVTSVDPEKQGEIDRFMWKKTTACPASGTA